MFWFLNAEFSIANRENLRPMGLKNPTEENQLPRIWVLGAEFSIPNRKNLRPIGLKFPTKENQVRPLTGLPRDLQLEIWQELDIACQIVY